jgi:hypothetical protein
MTFTYEKFIMWSPASWIWGETPTWYINGVCSESNQKAQTRAKQTQQTSKQPQQQEQQQHKTSAKPMSKNEAQSTINKTTL